MFQSSWCCSMWFFSVARWSKSHPCREVQSPVSRGWEGRAANFRMSACQGSGRLRAILIQPCSFDLWSRLHLETVEEIYVHLYKNIFVIEGICSSWSSSPGFPHNLPGASKGIQFLMYSGNEPGILSLKRQPSLLRLKPSVIRIVCVALLLKSISELMTLSC